LTACIKKRTSSEAAKKSRSLGHAMRDFPELLAKSRRLGKSLCCFFTPLLGCVKWLQKLLPYQKKLIVLVGKIVKSQTKHALHIKLGFFFKIKK